MSAVSDDELNRASDLEEGEGQDLVNQEEPFDSSEEEEDDDEEEAQKIREGFIVDDEDEEDQIKRRKKKHRRRPAPEEDEGLLDEDDLDLLMENSGARTSNDKSKFKRLKRASVEPEVSSSNGLNDFFSDDENEADDHDQAIGTSGGQRPRNVIDELDDFIEDDEDSELDEEERAQARQRRKEERLKPTELSGIDSEKVDELYDIFGDGEDYAWALEGEDEDGEFREDDHRPQLQDIYEPEELKARMLTEADKDIRDNDIPERFQELRRHIKNYELDDSEFTFEKQWVAFCLTNEKNLLQDPNHDVEAFQTAVSDVLTFIAKQNLEVPFIYSHRRDHLLKTTITGEGTDEVATQVQNLLVEDDLWRIVELDINFHSMLQKRQQIQSLVDSLQVEDQVLQEIYQDARSITDFQDVHDFISFKYSLELKDLGLKKSHKNSNYDKIKTNRLYDLVQAVGISVDEVVENISSRSKLYTTTDPEVKPFDLAQEICQDESSLYARPSQALEAAKHYYAESLFTNLKLRKHIRQEFTPYAYIDVELTTQGRLRIDKNSAYADFKYAVRRTVDEFYQKPDLFLRMLEAESLNLIEIHVKIMEMDKLVHSLYQFIESDGQSDVAFEWNGFRRTAIDLAWGRILPLLSINTKEEIRRECERLLYYQTRASFLKKVDQAPYQPRRPGHDFFGAVPRVFAVSPGNGQYGADSIIGVFMDEFGKVVDTYKFDQNPMIPIDRLPEGETPFDTLFAEQIRDCDPDVIVINGYNARTHKLYTKLLEIVEQQHLTVGDQSVDVIFANDEIASRFQYSTRATEEFPDKSTLVKYCIGLARYAQSPLLEYISLADDITSLSIHQHQGLLPEEKLREAIKSVFVDIVNMVGVDINRCVTTPYLAAMLPYVSGLGPRKAFGLLRAVQQHPLFSRQALITNDEIKIGSTIFLNCASFLRIPQTRNRALSSNDEIEAVTLLDDTRIHPEDYALAEKMAADAMDLDEEQIEELKDAPIGETVIDKLIEQGARLLNSLILEDYSAQLQEQFHKKKRATLQMIVEELEEPFGEIRGRFHVMQGPEIFEALTGETDDKFKVDAVVPVQVKRIDKYSVYLITSSLINCSARKPDKDDLQPGQTIQAKIISVDYDTFSVEVSLNKNDIAHQIEARPDYKIEGRWDFAKEQADLNLELKKENEKKKAKVINHPLFQPLNAVQAQNYLAPKERGDLVIRPSSKGDDHTAITWKVDNNLYQHLDVVEHYDPSTGVKRYQLGSSFYADYDEIIQSYIVEVVKNINAMTAHDKFHAGTKDSAIEWLENYLKANPKRGSYIFALNHKRPGWFLLLFKTSAASKLFSWNIKVTPTGFEMQNQIYPDMLTLCNGFKTIMQNGLSKPHTTSRNQGYNNGGYNSQQVQYNQGGYDNYNQGGYQNYSQGGNQQY